MEKISQLTSSQNGVYFENYQNPGSTMYNIPMCYTFGKNLDAQKLYEAVKKVCASYETFATTIRNIDGVFYNVVDEEKRAKYIEERVHFHTATEAEIQELRKNCFHRFELENSPLYYIDVYSTEKAVYLFTDIHHAVWDGTSGDVFIKSVTASYEGASLPAELISFEELAADEARLEENGTKQADFDFYAKLLDGSEAEEALDGDKTSEDGAGKIAEKQTALSVSEKELVSFAKAHGITENALLMNSFAYLLSKYTCSEEAVFSTVTASRRSDAYKSKLGMLVRTFPFYAKFDENESIPDMLKKNSAQYKQCLVHSTVDFGRLVNELNFKSEISFVYQGALWDSIEIGGAKGTCERLVPDEANCDFTCYVFKQDGTYIAKLKYNTEKYSETFIRYFVNDFQKVIGEFMQKQNLSEVSLISDEALAVYDKLNDNDVDFDVVSVNKLFEMQVAKDPQKTAVIVNGEQLTYGELNRFANRVAHALIKRGVHKDTIVGMVFDRTKEIFIAEQGILKSGAAFLPMVEEYPDDRISFCLHDAESPFVLTTEKIKAERKALFEEAKPCQVLTIEELIAEGADGKCDENPNLVIPTDSLAYSIYTSGSTGKPKGVMLEHRNMCNYVSRSEKNLSTRSMTDGVSTALSVTSIAFDMSINERYVTLCNGITLVMATLDEIHNPLQLNGLMLKHKVETIVCTPSYLSSLYDFEELHEALKYLKAGHIGGEMIPGALVNKIKTLNPGFHFINGYGPTEASVAPVGYEMEAGKRVVIGLPGPNVKCFVVDKKLRLLPPNAQGELLICGKGVGRGYVNLPDKTEAAFIEYRGYRAYHSGDKVRINSEGLLECFGRMDNQVKLRGLRIELDEIENVIASYDKVRLVKVIVRNNGTEDYLAGFFTADTKIDVSALKKYLATKLTPYMIPDALMQLDTMPLNTNGKIDKKKLPETVFEEEEIIPPVTETQKKICAAISELLGIPEERISIHTVLSSYGLSSISMLKLNVKLGKIFDVPLRTAELKKNNTVALIEKLVLSQRKTDSFERLPDYPLTMTQMGIYVETTANPGTTIYNIPHCFKLDESIEPERLKAAVEKTINAHPYLKTTLFINSDGEVWAKRNDDDLPLVEIISCENLPPEKELLKPFDLLKDALYRVKIFTTKEANYLFMELHHIASDGESIAVLLRDIEAAYAGEAVETEIFTGFEIALEEEKLRKTSRLKEAEEYYTSIFDGCEPDTLGKEPSDEASPENAYGFYETESPVDYAAAKQFSEKNGISLNALYLSTFGFTLSKYLYRDDCVFTTIYNGRSDFRTADSVTMLVKTLPVYVNIEKNDDVLTLCRDTQNQFMDSMSYDLYSFAEINRKFGIKSDIQFVFQGDTFAFDTVCGKKAETVPLRLDTAKNPLEIQVLVINGKLNYKVEYNAALYDELFIRSFIHAHQKAVLEFMQKKSLKEIELADKDDLTLFEGFRGKTVAVDENLTVLDLIRKQILSHPEKRAVVFNEKSFTYRELDVITKTLAKRISSFGVKKEDFVSVLIHRSHFMPLCSIGVLRTGAAYQPLDSSYPKDRLNYMMKDSGAKLLICDRDLRDLVDEYDGNVIFTDEIETDCAKINAASDFEEAKISGKDAFVILYTSGTTGLPKGVILEHHNITATIAYQIRQFGLNDSTKYAAYASYGFDANLMDTYTVLSAGGELHILDEDIRLDLAAIDDYFVKNEITASFMTTQVGRAFAEMASCETLKSLMAGGEKLVPLNFDDKNLDFINIYGPTECSVYVTTYKVASGEQDIPIGKPNDNLVLYIVDKNNRLLPYGAKGELCISGPQVGRGYLNLPEKTAAVFVENPFRSDKSYDRMYKTGDICSWLPDGNIAIAGRNDGQVKVRGFRIELTEVEKIIRDFAGIDDATVIALDNPSGGKMLAAYIVAGKEIDKNALCDFILETKPSYMVPSSIMQIEKIPLTVNGKVDKRKLPAPAFEEEEIIPPSNDMQKKICGAVSNLLGVPEDKISVAAPLSQYGLASISMLKLNVILGKLFDVPLKTAELKSNNTVALLEKLISSKKKPVSFVRLADYPLTMTQMGIFVETSANPDTTIYNIPSCFKVDSSIDAEKLKDATESAINAHPYLKVKLFTNADGDVRARRNDDALPHVEIVRCDSLPPKETLLKPFNLLKDNLYRAKIFVTNEANYLFLEIHHIVADGESMGILLHDIESAYTGKPLETESFTGYEIALEEERARETKQLKDAEQYYASVFSGTDPDCLITKSVDECEITGTYGFLSMESDADLAEVKESCQKRNVSMNAFYLSAFGYLLSKYLYREDAIFTTIYNGRSDSRMTNAVTMLVKTLPVYVNVEKDDDVAALCRTVQGQFTDSMANDLYSFAEISRNFGIKADIQFIFQGDLFHYDTICGKPAERVSLALNAAKTPMDIKVSIVNGKLTYRVEYMADFYDEAFIRQMLKNLDMAVKGFCEKQKLSEISLVSEDTLKVYEKLNDTDENFDVVSVNKLFEKQVAKDPQKTAVIVNNESLTYGELNRFANRVAHALIKRGVHKDSIVGMVFDRTKEIFIAEQGILKSGAAFLPMVEEYPDDRISFCLHDAESPFVLTTEKIKAERTALFEEAKPCQVLTIEELIAEGADGKRDENPNLDIPVDSLAYCIYTSGSTGKPKGVMLEHRNMCNYVTKSAKNISTTSLTDGISTSLSVTSIAFDMSLNERYVALCNGITLVMATLDEIHNPLQLNDLMLKHKVETIVCTPSYLSSLYDFEELHEALKNIRGSHIGGENLPDTLVKKIKTLNPAFRITNGYGPTETSVAPVGYEIEAGRRVVIGLPGPNVKCFVVDKKLNLLPPGIQGELLICGNGVGRGYINLPDKTEAAFINYRGYKAYHSGDKVRITTKGVLECFGRLDNQVKLRGLRIELDEIENVIASFDKVRLVKVIVRNNGTEDYLAGFFTADAKIDVAELKNYLATKLTPYMIPDALMQLDEMPLNTNGKIDKKALPETSVQFDEAEYVAPANDIEQFFCDTFAKVLKREKISATDNFFKIGGTSLSATRVVSFALGKGYNLVYKNVFKNPTPQLLAKFIQEESDAAPANSEASAKTAGTPPQGNPRDIKIRPALQGNTVEHLDEISYTPVGDVLLAGCTGFLGIHVLKELLADEKRKIYCLARKSGEETMEQRLNTMFFYYFAENLNARFGKQVFLIEGDITEDNLLEKVKDFDFTAIINCAACVKHFAVDDSIERVNFHGVEKLIAVALAKNAKLIHVSTTSVAGEGGPEFSADFKMTEAMCDFGQMHENQYVDSKLKAELAILDAIEQKGLRAKIIRVGNLSSRWKDGEFQINAQTNGFMSRLKAYKILGAFPVEMLDSEVEFSPIDYVAKSLLLLGGTPDTFTVFNNRNCHTVHFANIIEACNNFGMKVAIVRQKEFDDILAKTLANEDKTVQVSALLSYRNNEGKARQKIGCDARFTIKALYRLGFSWSLTGEMYIQKFLQALEMLDFFSE